MVLIMSLRHTLSALVLVALPLVASATPITVTVHTTDLLGTPAALAFDLIDGGLPGNTVTITGFTTDSVVGASSSTGDVMGTFPGTVALTDTEFFNEYVQSLTLGTFLTFTFDSTGNMADSASFPDGFSFFMLNPATNLPLSPTLDPTGADALLLFNIGEPLPLSIYSSRVTVEQVRAVPIPSTYVLIIGGFIVWALQARRVHMRCPS